MINKSDEELIECFNNDVRKHGWVPARSRFHAELKKEFYRRGFDYSPIGDNTHLSFADKIKLEDKKIVIFKKSNPTVA